MMPLTRASNSIKFLGINFTKDLDNCDRENVLNSVKEHKRKSE